MKKFILQTFIGSLLFMLAAFFNGYAFITSDSAQYIQSAFEYFVPLDRPVFYGWFVRISSLQLSLWFTLFWQCFILFFLLDRLMRITLKKSTHLQRLALTFAICFLTGVWWEANKIMADIFTAYLALAFILFIVDNQASKRLKISYLLIFSLATLVHSSHLAIALLLPIAWFIFTYFNRTTRTPFHWIFIVIFIGSWVSIGLTNYKAHDTFTLSKSSHVFLMGKMCENGMLERELRSQCSDNKWQLCAYVDSLPDVGWKYVWDANSPMAKLGGWNTMEVENKRILKSILLRPANWPLLLLKSVVTTFRQTAQISYGSDLIRYDYKSNIQQTIKKHYPHEYNSSVFSRQTIMRLPMKPLNLLYGAFFLLSSLLVLVFTARGKMDTTFKSVYIIAVLAILLNAGITGNLANLGDRLNTRIFWILPAIHILFLAKMYFSKWSNPSAN